MNKLIVLLILITIIPSGCIQSNDESNTEKPPLYLTIIIHTEEDMHGGEIPKSQIPDYDGNETLLLHFTNVMRKFGLMAASHGAKINFGNDWTFSEGVRKFDPTFYSDWENMGFEIDAHAHESFIMYNEVRDYIIDAGGNPTSVASGMNEENILEEMAYFDTCYPNFTILFGVSLPGHGAGECTAGWVWRPARDNWLTHDPDSNYLYIGAGEYLNNITAVERAIENRSHDRTNTYSVFFSPREFKASEGTPGIDQNWTTKNTSFDYWENKLTWWDEFLTQVDEKTALGEVEYASLTEISQFFIEKKQDPEFDISDVPRSDTPLITRQKRAGYPL